MTAAWQQALMRIGDDPTQWNTDAPLMPIPDWFDDEFERLIEIVSRMVSGDLDGARQLLRDATDRDEAMRAWYRLTINVGAARQRVLKRARPAPIGPPTRSGAASPKSIAAPIYIRDGHRCRYCGRRVVSRWVFERIERVIGSDVFRVKGDDTTRRGIVLTNRAVADHVIPEALGGPTTDANLVTSCYPCNFSKAGYSIYELGLTDPFSRLPRQTEWEGFESSNLNCDHRSIDTCQRHVPETSERTLMRADPDLTPRKPAKNP